MYSELLFKPTRLEQVLGKYYKWWYSLVIAFQSGTKYRVNSIFWLLGRLMILGFTVLIWYLNIEAGSTLFDFSTIFTYYVVGSFFYWQSWLHWNIAQTIFEGKISSLLHIPQDYFLMVSVKEFGWWLFSNIVEVGIFVSIGFAGREYLIGSTVLNITLFFVVRILATIINQLLQMIFGTLSFYLTQVDGLLNFVGDIEFFASGKAIPLNASLFLKPLQFLPYALLYYFPVQIYLGVYDYKEIFGIICLGIVWILVLVFILKITFHKGLKHYESVGL